MKITYYVAKVTIAIMLLFFQLSCTEQSTVDESIEVADIKEISVESRDLVTSMVEELMRLPNTPPGISVAISYDSNIIFSEGFGYSDLKMKKRVTSKTQFRAGSLSRMVTITAFAKLVEKGDLNFDDIVYQHVPNYPKKEYPFNIKQLVIGLSGMPHYSDQDSLEERHYKDVEDALSVFSHVPLSHKPGDKYQYSIHGYTLLSRIMEKASNKNFHTLLNDELLKPLSLLSTGPEILSKPNIEMSKLYQLHLDGINKNLPTQINNPKDYSYSLAGIGLVSTPTDMVKLATSFTNGFVRKDIVDTIFERQMLNSGDTIRQGIGWDQNWDMADRKVFEQDGSGEGTRSIVSVFPKHKIAISIMTNALRLHAIEETAHTLSLPFLTAPSPEKQPIGDFELNVKEDDGGNGIKMKGNLILNGENDRLIINPNTENEEMYKLIYLKRKNIYALIHPEGILYTEINLNNKIITGKVMYYRGPNIHKTSGEPPYIKFKSIP
jgi:CubicO group peptidase (beta-lactamase class C family)